MPKWKVYYAAHLQEYYIYSIALGTSLFLSKALINWVRYFLKSKYSTTASKPLQQQLQECKWNII